MTNYIFRVVCSLIILLTVTNCSAQEKFPELSGSYFGQTVPKERAEVFMEGVISKLDETEMCAVFSEDGKEFYFNAEYNGNITIFETREINGKWTRPKPINFTGDYIDKDFTISPDGNRLYLGSNRPRRKGEPKLERRDIYYSERICPGNWSEPINVGEPVNTDYDENYPSIDSAGNLFFFSNRNEGLGGYEIYYSEFIDNNYTTPILLNENINSNKNDWDSFVAKDGSFLIFVSQNRDDTIGKQDLYISFKTDDGKWSKAVNMGFKVNSAADEICPSVTLDGKYFFFTSRRRGTADIYWIDARIIEELKQQI